MGGREILEQKGHGEEGEEAGESIDWKSKSENRVSLVGCGDGFAIEPLAGGRYRGSLQRPWKMGRGWEGAGRHSQVHRRAGWAVMPTLGKTPETLAFSSWLPPSGMGAARAGPARLMNQTQAANSELPVKNVTMAGSDEHGRLDNGGGTLSHYQNFIRVNKNTFFDSSFGVLTFLTRRKSLKNGVIGVRRSADSTSAGA